MTIFGAAATVVASAGFFFALTIGFGGLPSYADKPAGPGNGGITVPAVTATALPGHVPPVSDRQFASGSAHGIASGDLAFDLQLPIDKDKAYVQDGLAWIAFGSPGDPRAILVSLDEPENSVAISQGGDTALGVDDQCDFDITVTDAQVSGHISCPEADVIEAGETVGTVAIELDFTAGS